MYRKYSREYLLEDMKNLCNKLNRKPTNKEINSRAGFPTTGSYRSNFGDINEVVKLVRPDLSIKGKRYSDFYIKSEFARVSKILNKAPTIEEFDKESETVKSCIIKKRFGWNKLIKELGLKQNSPRFKSEELIEILKSEAKKLGRTPILDDFVKNKELPNICAFYNNFNSWEDALKRAGFDTRHTVYKAKDGHKCLSVMELYIDNWLFENKIEHEKEVFYPFHEIYNKNTRKRCDFFIDGKYIEFCGLIRRKEYRDKIEIKKKLIEELGLKFIFIYPTDLDKLDKVMGTPISLGG